MARATSFLAAIVAACWLGCAASGLAIGEPAGSQSATGPASGPSSRPVVVYASDFAKGAGREWSSDKTDVTPANKCMTIDILQEPNAVAHLNPEPAWVMGRADGSAKTVVSKDCYNFIVSKLSAGFGNTWPDFDTARGMLEGDNVP